MKRAKGASFVATLIRHPGQETLSDFATSGERLRRFAEPMDRAAVGVGYRIHMSVGATRSVRG